ncbi:LuxR C-terminal-related transcriptional regulator [Kibdelosporangium philippinense]|uniref:LuxR C-terminal-related transcriptional regulator n=1 Tax=Kibdelosporangium philippinense TaxID=211113 RepID=A0ABS8Z9A3_9PSEU|nr:LuxR C-terminal-related transcriptional regulator [Kibdelosporangium philippinense]MCE7003613.1 LuxR C-terminal-related transcriptional regulator [Kibdelosporangium philippinense]
MELASVRDPLLVAHTAVQVLDIPDQSGRPPLELLIDFLRQRQALLILDTCEHLVDECAKVADALLREVRHLRIMATSRESLRVAGEQLLIVEPLSLPKAASDPDHPAIRLFIDRAGAVVSNVALDAGNRERVIGICRRVEGIPLAIELAAALLRYLSLEQILQRLDDRFPLLTTGPRLAAARHQTLRAAIDWSFELCTSAEQRLWSRLSVFPGSFDLEAAERVYSECGSGPAEVAELFEGLVGKSILTGTDSGTGRYLLLDTLRQYAAEKLSAAGEDETLLRQRHADWCRRLTEHAEQEWFGRSQQAWYHRMRLEHANLRAALDFYLEAGQTRTAQRMANTLWFYWVGCGRLAEGHHWLNRVLAADSLPSRERAKALWVNGYYRFTVGNSEAATRMADECLGWARQHNDDSTAAHAMFVHAGVRLIQGDFHAAEALAEQAIARFAASGEVGCVPVMAQCVQATALAWRGDHARAIPLAQQPVEICQRHGEQWSQGWARYVLAVAHWHGGELAEAAANTREGLRIKRIFNDVVGVGFFIDMLSWIAGRTGDHERAAELIGAADQVWRLTGGEPRIGSPILLDPHEQCARQARLHLGDQAFHAAVDCGAEHATDLEHAAAYALGEATRSRPSPAWHPDTATLTARERQVAQLVAEGLSNKQIAARLVIAPRTAEGHVERILTKLGFAKRAQIATWIHHQHLT